MNLEFEFLKDNLNGQLGYDYQHTVKLLDFFAISAPPVPEWFRPEMTIQAPKEPPKINVSLTVPEQSLYHKFYDEVKRDWKIDTIHFELQEKVRAHFEAWDKAGEDMEAWDDAFQIEKFRQWPYFYASMVMEHRSQIKIM